MKTLFKPSKKLMDGVSYPEKFGIIFLIVLIPMFVLSLYLLTYIRTDIQLLENERLGLSYIKILRQPVEHIQQHRGMVAAYLDGATEFHDLIIQKQTLIDEKLVQLTELDIKLGKQFDVTKSISKVIQLWGQIKANSMNLPTQRAINVHTVLIDDLLALKKDVADASKLVLDPNIDSYYMGNVIVSGLPNMIENMGQARAQGAAIAAKGGFSNQALRVELSILSNNIDLYFEDISFALQKVYEVNKKLSKDLKVSTDANNTAIREIQSLLADKLLNAETVTIDGIVMFNAATKAINGSYKLYDALMPRLDTLFVERIAARRSEMYIAISVVLGVLILVVYLFSGFFYSVTESIQTINASSRQLALGNLDSQIKLKSRDEMTKIADSFNDMVDRLKYMRDAMMKQNHKLQELSIRDGMTGLFNHRHLIEIGQNCVAEALRYHRPLSCMMIDIDYFKAVNDNYGHPFGDFVLTGVAKLLQSKLRKVDIVSRYGGEEFVVIMPTTDIVNAEIAADKIREAIEVFNFRQNGVEHKITVSVGVAEHQQHELKIMTLLARADKALYQSKASGRNKVTSIN